MFKDPNSEDMVLHESNLSALALDQERIYKKVMKICELKSQDEDFEDLRDISGYIDGVEFRYHIEGFDFLRVGNSKEIELLLLLRSSLDERELGEELLKEGEVYKFFRDGNHFSHTYHPVSFTILNPRDIGEIEEMISSTEGRDFVKIDVE